MPGDQLGSFQTRGLRGSLRGDPPKLLVLGQHLEARRGWGPALRPSSSEAAFRFTVWELRRSRHTQSSRKGPSQVRAGQQQMAGTFSAPGYLTSLPAWSSSWSSGDTAGANGVGGEDKVLLSGLASLPLGLGRRGSIVVSTWALDSDCRFEPRPHPLSENVALDELGNLSVPKFPH